MKVTAFNTERDRGHMVKVNKEEALRIIASLAGQILSQNPNSDRVEFRTDIGHYFSIAVHTNNE